jgi:hypothetical protein
VNIYGMLELVFLDLTDFESIIEFAFFSPIVDETSNEHYSYNFLYLGNFRIFFVSNQLLNRSKINLNSDRFPKNLLCCGFSLKGVIELFNLESERE